MAMLVKLVIIGYILLILATLSYKPYRGSFSFVQIHLIKGIFYLITLKYKENSYALRLPSK